MDECLPPQLDQDSQHGCFEAADATVFFMVLPPVLLQNPKHFALPNITRLDVSNLASTVHAWCEGSKKGYAAAGKTLEYLGLDVAFTLSMNQWVARTPKGVGLCLRPSSLRSIARTNANNTEQGCSATPGRQSFIRGMRCSSPNARGLLEQYGIWML